jgi:regulator of RNase E activity RraA
MNLEKFRDLLSTDVADAMGQACAMDIGIHCLIAQGESVPKLMGFAYTVRCENRSNTYLHDAIYSAPKDAIIVVEADSNDYAIAGGNVCAVAQQNGIDGFVIDGVVRDIAEVRSIGFPVFARGAYPKPGKKGPDGEAQCEINCGNLTVNPGDLIVADEEGIVVVPAADIQNVLEAALTKKGKAEMMTLADWRANHYQKIQEIIAK